MKWYLVAGVVLLPCLTGVGIHRAGLCVPSGHTNSISSTSNHPAVRSMIPREVRQHQARHWRSLVLQAAH